MDIPVEAEDGGSIASPLDKRLRFVVWQDYAGENGGKSTFGVYDAANRVFFGLPAALRKNVLLSSAMPVLFNGVIVGAVVHYCYAPVVALPLCMLCVAVGEAIAVYVCGMILLKAMEHIPEKYRL